MTSLCELKVEVTKLSTQKQPSLFCKKYSMLLTPKLLEEHKCLSKRTYTNKEGEEIQIVCPNCFDLSAQPLYQKLYSKEPLIVQDEKETLAVTTKLDVFTKTEQSIAKIRKAYLELQGE